MADNRCLPFSLTQSSSIPLGTLSGTISSSIPLGTLSGTKPFSLTQSSSIPLGTLSGTISSSIPLGTLSGTKPFSLTQSSSIPLGTLSGTISSSIPLGTLSGTKPFSLTQSSSIPLGTHSGTKPFSLTQSSLISLGTLSGTKRGFEASNTAITTTNNGGTLPQNLGEVPNKKSRGRPKGSKNKPKPPVFINENSETLLESIHIEIPSGRDIIEPLLKLALSRQARIIVLSGSGLVSEVNFLHPVTRASGIPIEGVFRMTSFFGTFAGANTDLFPAHFASTSSPNSHFSIFLSGNEGKVFGGAIGGRVIAAGAVFISAALVKNPTFDRLGINADRNQH